MAGWLPSVPCVQYSSSLCFSALSLLYYIYAILYLFPLSLHHYPHIPLLPSQYYPSLSYPPYLFLYLHDATPPLLYPFKPVHPSRHSVHSFIHREGAFVWQN
jgi:hypothetical protein